MIYQADHFLEVEYDTKNPIEKTDGSTSVINRTIATHIVELPVILFSLVYSEQH